MSFESTSNPDESRTKKNKKAFTAPRTSADIDTALWEKIQPFYRKSAANDFMTPIQNAFISCFEDNFSYLTYTKAADEIYEQGLKSGMWVPTFQVQYESR